MRIRRKTFRIIASFLLVGYWTALALGTHWPHTAAPSGIRYNDKLAHFAGYAGLAFLLSLCWSGWQRARRRTLGIILALCLTYGVLDELLQLPIPGRSAELADWMADAVGVLTGLGAFLLFRNRSRDLLEPAPR